MRESEIIAANGEKLQVTGKCELPFHIGNIDASHPVLITKEVPQECLLGAEFLNKHNCVIDLPNGSLYSHRNIPPLIVQKGTPVQTCYVSFLETTTIPARHQIELPVQLRKKPQSMRSADITNFTGLLEPEPKFQDDTGLLVAHSVSTTIRGETLVRILNPLRCSIVVHKGEKVGCMHPLSNGNGIHVIGRSTTSGGNKNLEDVVESLVHHSQLPFSPEKVQLASLLYKFSDVISLHDGDMGKTNVVKHTINTGDALPIRQQPRRLPFHQREEVQRLQDMLKQRVIEPANSPPPLLL